MATTRQNPFRTWQGVEPFEYVPGVHIHAIGGEQVLVLRVSYQAAQIPPHSHEHTEQVIVVTEGEGSMTVDGETKTIGPGDVVVIGRGIEHGLSSETGITFFEALAPVLRDHVPDPERDLVLGPDGGRLHVDH
jgi:quercetin dioxygenase-like cupin family protein